MDVAGLANEIDQQIRALPEQTTEPVRRVRCEFSKRLQGEPAEDLLALGQALLERHRWVGYELIANHPTAMQLLDAAEVERLGRGMDSWWSVDAFARIISGPAWREGLLQDDVIRRWAESDDRWWRRAALVSTVALNDRSRGGTGDTMRTLDICARLAPDRDDMVIKAMSWALRELVPWDPDATRRFVADHEDILAARAKREVRNKLDTGLKNPKR
ncbi:MAG: DNA alkylation repair protein [Acidimicrobiia bacterium]|nr:DNA alkylation repair protein [Acidimicrobiia bacterium]